jgi:protein-tyrosine phosphatase
VVDLHAHILPGIDDGPSTSAQAVAIARAAVAAGTRVLAATPHVNARFDPAPAEIAQGVEELRALLAAEDVPLQLVGGAEIAQARVAELDDEALCALALGSGRHVLLECQPPAARDVEADVHDLLERGHGVLLAHAERCEVFRSDPPLVARLVEAGALVSITAASFTGAFGGGAERLALALLANGLVHDIASDAHDPEHRSPDQRPARRRVERMRGGDEWWRWLTDAVPAALIAADPLPPAPAEPPATRRRRLRRLLG